MFLGYGHLQQISKLCCEVICCELNSLNSVAQKESKEEKTPHIPPDHKTNYNYSHNISRCIWIRKPYHTLPHQLRTDLKPASLSNLEIHLDKFLVTRMGMLWLWLVMNGLESLRKLSVPSKTEELVNVSTFAFLCGWKNSRTTSLTNTWCMFPWSTQGQHHKSLSWINTPYCGTLRGGLLHLPELTTEPGFNIKCSPLEAKWLMKFWRNKNRCLISPQKKRLKQFPA